MTYDTIYTLYPDGSLRPLKVRLPEPSDPLVPMGIFVEKTQEALPIHTTLPKRV